MATRNRLRHSDTPVFGAEDMSNREWREYCRGIRIFRDDKIQTPFHEAMNATGEPTVIEAITTAITERENIE